MTIVVCPPSSLRCCRRYLSVRVARSVHVLSHLYSLPDSLSHFPQFRLFNSCDLLGLQRTDCCSSSLSARYTPEGKDDASSSGNLVPRPIVVINDVPDPFVRMVETSLRHGSFQSGTKFSPSATSRRVERAAPHLIFFRLPCAFRGVSRCERMG